MSTSNIEKHAKLLLDEKLECPFCGNPLNEENSIKFWESGTLLQESSVLDYNCGCQIKIIKDEGVATAIKVQSCCSNQTEILTDKLNQRLNNE